MGQVVANFLSNPLASGGDSDAVGWPYVAFHLDPTVVRAARNRAFPILYGDGSRSAVLQSAGISSPKAIIIMYAGKKKTTGSVQRLRLTFPTIPIYNTAQDLMHLLDLKEAGATDAILEKAETSLQLGSMLLKDLGIMSDDIEFLSQLIRDSMELQAQEVLNQSEYRELDMLKPLQVRVDDMIETREPAMATTSPDYEVSELNQTDKAFLCRIQMEEDSDEQGFDPTESVCLEGNCVLYRKEGTEKSSIAGYTDALVEKNLADPSIPLHTAMEKP